MEQIELIEIKIKKLIINSTIVELGNLKDKLVVYLNKSEDLDYTSLAAYSNIMNIIYDRLIELENELKLLNNEQKQ